MFLSKPKGEIIGILFSLIIFSKVSLFISFGIPTNPNSSASGITPIIFYLGAIFWTLGYDTIYGFQDIEDDEIIGVKSTSIKFKKNPKIFLSLCYFLFILFFIITGIKLNFNKYFFIGTMTVFFHLFIIQIMNFDKKNKEKCLKIFKSNNFLGLIILICILIGKLN